MQNPLSDQQQGQWQTGWARPASSSASSNTRGIFPQDSELRYRELGVLRGSRGNQLAKALGWFSIGLGLTQLLAPRTLSRAAGVSDHPVLMRALALREITSGVGILSQRPPTGWLWSRVAGDAIDLALLGTAARSSGVRRSQVALAVAAVAGVTALDVAAGMQHNRRDAELRGGAADGSLHVHQAITVNRTAQDCYQFWRSFENFPRFMRHLEQVQATGDNRSHWKAKGPAGTSVEWDAEMTDDQPGQLLAWRAVDGADVENAGRVHFEQAPGGRGTVVRVDMQYRPPGGQAGAMVARLFGEEPAQQIKDDLRHFKQLIETGEIPTTEGQSSGRRSTIARILRKGAPG
jgi:uncharacterized membrane protein